MRSETNLLLTCSHSRLTGEQKQKISVLLTEELDWDLIVEMAIHHRTIPLLYRSIIYFKNEIPSTILTTISNHLRLSAIHTLTISASLINIINLFNNNEIEVLPIKGGILAQKLYGSITMRTYSDVDILVHKKDIESAINLLLKNDYTLLPEGISQLTYLKFLRYNHHGRLRDSNGILVELHWELSGFYSSEPMTLKSLQSFLCKVTFNNCPILALTNEMLFTFLCLHGNKHRWEKLDDICSIAELMNKRHEIDWPLVFELGKKHNMVKRILLSLSLAEKLLGASMPVQAKQMMRNAPDVACLAKAVIDEEINNPNQSSAVHPFQKTIRFQFNVMNSIFDASKFILRSTSFPEHDDWEKIQLPNSFFLLYFLYKPYYVLGLPIVNRIKSFLGIQHSGNREIA